MPRDLDPELEALIDTGHFRRWTAITITLGNGAVLRFARAEQTVGGDTFLGRLDVPAPLKLSLQGQQTDRQEVNIANLDLILGQQLTGLVSALDGATAMVHSMFQAADGTGPVYLDDRVPCDVVSGPVTREWAEIQLIGEMYAGFIAGETVYSIFPYQENLTAVQPASQDPNDIITPGGGGGGGEPLDPHPGRLPPFERFPILP